MLDSMSAFVCSNRSCCDRMSTVYFRTQAYGFRSRIIVISQYPLSFNDAHICNAKMPKHGGSNLCPGHSVGKTDHAIFFELGTELRLNEKAYESNRTNQYPIRNR